jgi:hypothetical protein
MSPLSTSRTHVADAGSTCVFPSSRSSYIVTLLGMTVQERSEVVPVLGFFN